MRGALGAALSGALLLAAAPPLALSPLVFAALVPLLVAVRAAPGAFAAAGLGWLTGALFHAGLLAWLPATIVRLQELGWPAALALTAAFHSFHALQFAAAALCMRLDLAGRSRGAAAVAGWVLLEWAFPKVFPWSLGATLGPHPLLRQAADLVGVSGLAAAVVLVNALLADALASWRAAPARAGAALASAALLLGGGAAYGAWRPTGAGAGGALRIALVQGGERDGRAADPQRADARTWAAYATLSGPLAGRADLVVWPEVVLRSSLREPSHRRDRAQALARALRAAVVLGALDRAPDGGDRNAAFVFTPALSAIAHKAVLVPFGEYTPGAAWLPVGRAWRPPAPRRAGSPSSAVTAAGIRFAPSMCFEAIRPGAFNAAVRQGAALLVNLSDDSWFASSWAAAQHLEMIRLRAVETRRWLVRASQSGISAVVDPDGAVVAALPYGARGALLRAVVPGHALTRYVRWGDAPLLLASTAVLLVALCAARSARR